jgi:hypothetical protein
MKNSEVSGYSLFPKQHECTLQDIRHERKAEDLRLERLKKSLHIQMHGDREKTEDVRAA